MIDIVTHSINIYSALILIVICLNNLKFTQKKNLIVTHIICLILGLIIAVFAVHFLTPNVETTIIVLNIFSKLGIVLNVLSFIVIIIYLRMQNKAAYIDYLTGAYNRQYLDYYMNKKLHICKNGSRAFSCVLIDLDNFKRTNDMFGHDTGDKSLKATVDLLRKCISKKDVIARYGGDEFYIVLNIDKMEELKCTVKKFAKVFNKYNSSVIASHKISYSIGYDVYNREIWDNAHDFLSHIDMLMYEDKKQNVNL